MANLLYLLVGSAGGVLGGLIGIGGATFIIPLLVFAFGFSEHKAQGTTLAMMVPPIGFLAAWQYYKQNMVDLRVAALMAVGFFVGGFIGAKIAVNVSNVALQRIFGAALLLIGLKLVLAR
jgi:uncharacterized membrane protein YfcA